MEARGILGMRFLALVALMFLALCVSLNSGEEEQGVEPILDEFSLQRSPRDVKFRLPSLPNIGRSYHVAPKNIPGIPGLTRARPKTSVQGGGGKRARWVDNKNKKIYEWDSQHGELEKYSKTGKHEGAVDPNTGAKIKDAVAGRKIEP